MPETKSGHALMRTHWAGQLEKMAHDDPNVLKRIHMTDEVYLRMDRGSTRQKSYEIHISSKPYRVQAKHATTGTFNSLIYETCDLF